MKTHLLCLSFFFIAIAANAQSTLKLGGYFNSDINVHKLGKLTYPSLEFTFEKPWGKKFSFNLSYNFSMRDVRRTPDLSNGQVFGNTRWTNFNHALIPEIRYYPLTNSNGFFFQFGVPITLTYEKDYYTSISGDGSYSRYSIAFSTMAGIGIKYPLSSKIGIEMNMSISPTLNFLGFDYGTSGFIKSGIKLYFLPGKTKH